MEVWSTWIFPSYSNQLSLNCLTWAAEPETVLEALRQTPHCPSIFTQQGLLQTALVSDVTQIATQ